MPFDSEKQTFSTAARKSAIDPVQITARYDLAKLTAKTFTQVGEELQVVSEIFDDDRADGKSPYGHGSDEVVAFSYRRLTYLSCQSFRRWKALHRCCPVSSKD